MKSKLLLHKILKPSELNKLRILLIGLFILYSISYIDQILEKLSNKNINSNNDNVINNPFPGKCILPNYNDTVYMSIVYTWVNGSIPCYRNSRQKYGGIHAVGGSRDREFGELLFSIRSLEKNMPWHKGNIYIVSPGHVPNWYSFKKSNNRLFLVNQDDFFPTYAKKYLPTFNTNVIEQFLYLIPGLTDIYMQVNDDNIFIKKIYPHDFFNCDGSIKILQEKSIISHIPPTNDKGIWISSVLNTQQEMDKAFGSDKVRKFLKHAPFVYSRKGFERIHQIFNKGLYNSLKNKFRSRDDMNIPLLHHYYMLHVGQYELGIPVREGGKIYRDGNTPQYYNEEIDNNNNVEMEQFRLFIMRNNNIKEFQDTFNNLDNPNKAEYNIKILAINDEYTDMKVAENALSLLTKRFPDKSLYERDSQDNTPQVYSFYSDDTTCNIIPNLFTHINTINSTIIADMYNTRYPFYLRGGKRETENNINVRSIRWILLYESFLRCVGWLSGLLALYTIVNYLSKFKPFSNIRLLANALNKIHL